VGASCVRTQSVCVCIEGVVCECVISPAKITQVWCMQVWCLCGCIECMYSSLRVCVEGVCECVISPTVMTQVWCLDYPLTRVCV